MKTDTQFKDLLLMAIPRLRAFAMPLSRDAARAEDLTQETLVKAWTSRGSFCMGTNLHAWLRTILRNEFYTQMRRSRRELRDENGLIAAQV